MDGQNGLAVSDLLTYIYPVGSIYLSAANVSPASFLGGTWTRIKDVFLLTAGDTYTAGSTGGEAAHTLTADEMPSHNHKLKITTAATATGSNWPRVTTSGTETDSIVAAAGGGQAHNNMPPYLTVYAWQRTA